MEPNPSLDATLRLTIFTTFLRAASPPVVEQLMEGMHLRREEVEESLDRLDAARHLKLVPGTHRVLMAFPFSAIATPYRVRVDSGQSYFANCAWDAVAFHTMLRKPIQIDSFCFHCGAAIHFSVREGKAVTEGGDLPVVYLGLPAADWWKDIVTTCANTMLFFATERHFSDWRRDHPGAQGAELTIDVVLRLSEPLYAGKLEHGYTRPSRDQLVQLFQDLKLTGDFWKI